MSTIGPQKVDDRRGWLLFEWLPDELQRAEDATQHRDITLGTTVIGATLRAQGVRRVYEYDAFHSRAVWALYRPATPTERALLEHLGYVLPAQLETRLQFITET